MDTDTQESARRVTELIQRAHEVLQSGGDPAGTNPRIRFSMATLAGQAAALGAGHASVVARTDAPHYNTAKDHLLAAQREMTTWNWDEMERDELRAGCQLVLDIAGLVADL